MDKSIKKEEILTLYDPLADDLSLAERLHLGTQMALKYMSLVTLTLQNAALNLLMRMARTQTELFLASTAVLMAEVMKLAFCLFMIGVDEGNCMKFLAAVRKHIVNQPMDTLKVSIPSLVYLLQNNLLYVGATHLDAATCQVTYQLKILTTALFSVAMLNKRLNMHQWFALITLFAGVALVQFAQINTASTGHFSHEQKPLVGFLAIVAACCLSGFAGVYFEKILKGSDVTIWIRNVQLCVASIPLGLGSVYVMDSAEVSSLGFFHGYNKLVWLVIALNAFGGIVVALVVKYADNILKGFATSLAIVLSCIVSVYFFNFQLTGKFVFGAALVIGSIFMYSHPQSHKK